MAKMDFSSYSYSYCGVEQCLIRLESSVDSIPDHLACINAMGSDPQLFLMVIYLVIPMLKWIMKPRGFTMLMRAKLHEIPWRV